MKTQVTGFATLLGTSDPRNAAAVKKLLATPDGTERALSIPLFDENGDQVAVLEGALKPSKKGNLTARFALKLDVTAENLVVRQKKSGEKGTLADGLSDELAALLGE